MTKNFVLSFGLLCLVACPLLESQSAAPDCTNDMRAAGEVCPPAQPDTLQTPAENGAANFTEGARYRVPATLGPAAVESVRPTGRPAGNQPQGQEPPDAATEFQRFVAGTTGQLLPLYGEDLFRRVPSTFSPDDQAPVPSTYVIGPDDELRIRIWGQINFSGNVRVDRAGNIYLPQVGTIPVTALRFSEVDQHIRSAVARLYRNFDLSVEIGGIRSIQIYVSGEARRPGAYTISSLSTLVNALFATGGPSPQGSLRHILLKREGKTIADFDLYALLMRGDKSQDVRLLPEDVLYIPPVGREVAITGSVRNPGIYELGGAETIGDLIEMAGKVSTVASNTRISLDRMEQQQSRRALEFDFNAAGLAAKLEDGDILHIFPILPAYGKTVTIRGNVANPGRFAWHPGMRLSDLIPDQDSLLSRDYWWKRNRLGLPAPEFAPVAPEGRETSAPESANSSIASSMTEAASQGHEKPAERNEVRLGANQINWSYAVIERVDPKSLLPSLLPFDLGKLVLDHDDSQNLALQPGDAVSIFSQSDIVVPLDKQVKYIELEGEFVHPGYYSVGPSETLRDVVRRAGGFTPRAYLFGSEFTRESTRIIQQQRLNDYVQSVTMDAQRATQALAVTTTQGASSDVAASQALTQQMAQNLSKLKATGRIVLEFRPGSSSIDDVPAISVENADKFVVPFAPASVNVVGAVYDQNSFIYQPGRNLGYYLRQAGGSNRNADWRHAFLIRADGSVISRTHRGGVFSRGSFEGLELHAGDTLVVPEKILRPTALRGFMDWSQVFSQLALGAAAVNVL